MASTVDASGSGTKRWMTEEETKQIVKAAALALMLSDSPMTTSKLLEELEEPGHGPAPPARTRSGRLRQLEKALEGEQASAAGISVEPGKFRNGKGRAATRRWHVDSDRARARLVTAA